MDKYVKNIRQTNVKSAIINGEIIVYNMKKAVF